MPKRLPAESMNDAINGRIPPPAENCPFCGGEDLEIEGPQVGTMRWHYHVICACGVRGPLSVDDYIGAVKKWNDRK